MSRVRGTIRDRQAMRSFNMGGILFDFPDPVSPLRPRCSTRYFYVIFSSRLGHCKRYILELSSELS